MNKLWGITGLVLGIVCVVTNAIALVLDFNAFSLLWLTVGILLILIVLRR